MWEFNELKTTEPERDPHETEFFRHTISAEAIVREAIQNSLDARNGQECVKIRFAFGNIKKSDIKYCLDKLEPHIEACNLMPKEYKKLSDIPIFIIEDFGTTGLNGETGENGRPQSRSNFYSFWWCEGKSSKSGIEGGRWGLGKTTFHLASKLRVFWGLTIRHNDPRKLLMGKALLKTHRIDKKVYSYYGYFKDKNNKPIDKEQDIQDFYRKFQISRRTESGLSIVIPMPDEEITYSAVIQSIIIHYFYAIMEGMLKVEVEKNNNKITLNKNNIIENARKQDWTNSSWEDINVLEMLGFIKDAENIDPIKLILKDCDKLTITEDSFDDFSKIKELFNEGKLLSFRIPIKIRKSNTQDNSHFDVYVKKVPQLKRSEEIYIRSGITIPEETKKMSSRSVRGIFVAQDKAIAEFLGDCENPAHTKWNERTEGFKDKYSDAVKILRFIKNSMARIVSILDQPPQEIQKDLIKNIFSVPIENQNEEDKEEDEEKGNKKTDKGNKSRIGRVPPKNIIKQPPLFKVTKSKGGFKISLNDDKALLPIKLKIRVAYDIRKGNPFRNYSLFDFDLTKLTVESTGCSIDNIFNNEMEIKVKAQDFSMEINGFDLNRDLVIDIHGGRNRQ